MALIAPERVRALGLLCPAVAWVKRDFHPIVRLLRPEFGLLPHGFSRSAVQSQFADRDLIDPAVAEVMVDEFRRIYHSAGARYAFLSSARNIYLEAPHGRHSFYPRLADLSCPALFVWGSHDRLVPSAFRRHVAQWLPSAEQITLENCGHVPQVERPEETNQLLIDFFARAQATEPAPPYRDPDFIRERLPRMWLMASLWYRGEVRGLGNITVGTLPPIDLQAEFGPNPDVDDVYDHLIRLMQDTLDALAAERRLPVIG